MTLDERKAELDVFIEKMRILIENQVAMMIKTPMSERENLELDPKNEMQGIVYAAKAKSISKGDLTPSEQKELTRYFDGELLGCLRRLMTLSSLLTNEPQADTKNRIEAADYYVIIARASEYITQGIKNKAMIDQAIPEHRFLNIIAKLAEKNDDAVQRLARVMAGSGAEHVSTFAAKAALARMKNDEPEDPENASGVKP